jgi:hypothetical protein
MRSLPILFDPALLAFVPDVKRDEFVSRVAFLARWAQFIRTADANIHIAPEVREFLTRSGFFPAHDAVAATIDALDLRYRFAPEDVIGPVNSILNRASTSLYCCIRDADHENFSSSPDQPWHVHEALNHQTQRTVLLARMEQLLHSIPSKLVLATLILGNPIKFSAFITVVEPDDVAGFSTVDLPKLLEGEITVSTNLEGVLDCGSAIELWTSASDNADIKLAIQMRCREKQKADRTYISFESLPKFFVGEDFYASLQRNQASGTGRFASVTLEDCACAVSGSSRLEWRPFNKNRRRFDNAAPLRAHLTTGSMALRLMAWERPTTSEGKSIELANVGPKWEEEIASTDPTKAV